MPGIDYSILLGQQPLPAPRSPLQSYASVLGIKQAQQQIAAGDAEAKARQQAQKEQQAVEAGYRAAINPETGQFDENRLLANVAQSAPGRVPAIQKSLADLRKSALDAQKVTSDLTKAKDDHDAANVDYLAAAAHAINQLPEEERAAAFGSTMAFLESKEGGSHDTSVVKQAQAQGRTVQQMIDGLLAASKQQRELRTSEQNAATGVTNAQTARMNAEKTPPQAPRNLDPFTEAVRAREEKLKRKLTEDEIKEINRSLADRPQVAAPLTPQQNALVDAVIAEPAMIERLTNSAFSEIAGELQRRGFKAFGKSMNESAVNKVAESRSAILSLQDLRTTLQENEKYIGPITGFFESMNPYSEAQQAKSKINLVRQRVGKALEGGVLRKEDEEKYKTILATLEDVPETAIYKVDNIIATLQRDLETFIDTQRQAGRNTSGVQQNQPAAKPTTAYDLPPVDKFANLKTDDYDAVSPSGKKIVVHWDAATKTVTLVKK